MPPRSLVTRVISACAVPVLLLVIAHGPATPHAAAQSGGVLTGTVVADVDGLPLEGAQIALTPVYGGKTTKRKVKADGAFNIAVGPGRYRLEATLPGFKLYEETVSVAANETLSQAVRLKLGVLSETVHLGGDGPVASLEKRTLTEKVDIARRAASKERLLPPVVLRHVYPAYGRELARAGKVGEVVLLAIMNDEGRLTNVTVVKSAHDELAALATEAVKDWEYDPARLNGRPVEAIGVTLRFVFGG